MIQKTTIGSIFCAFFVMVASNRINEDFDSIPADIEVPRVERTHPDTITECHGNINCIRQNSESPVGGLWFGPRLGRRRRAELKNTGRLTGAEKRQETTFTPRLGRELSDLISAYKMISKDEEDQDSRDFIIATPRLEFELRKLLRKFNLL